MTRQRVTMYEAHENLRVAVWALRDVILDELTRLGRRIPLYRKLLARGTRVPRLGSPATPPVGLPPAPGFPETIDPFRRHGFRGGVVLWTDEPQLLDVGSRTVRTCPIHGHPADNPCTPGEDLAAAREDVAYGALDAGPRHRSRRS